MQVAICQCIYLSVCLSACLPSCLSIYVPLCTYPYIYLSIYLSIYPSVRLSIYVSICLCPSIHLAISPPIYISDYRYRLSLTADVFACHKEKRKQILLRAVRACTKTRTHLSFILACSSTAEQFQRLGFAVVQVAPELPSSCLAFSDGCEL